MAEQRQGGSDDEILNDLIEELDQLEESVTRANDRQGWSRMMYEGDPSSEDEPGYRPPLASIPAAASTPPAPLPRPRPEQAAPPDGPTAPPVAGLPPTPDAPPANPDTGDSPPPLGPIPGLHSIRDIEDVSEQFVASLDALSLETDDATKSMETETRERRSMITVLRDGIMRLTAPVAGVVAGVAAGAAPWAAQTASGMYQAPAALGQQVRQGAAAALSPATALTGTASSLGSMLGQFVQAFSPSTVLSFNLALKDVTAVIGQALAPVMQVLTGVVREVGSMMMPIARELGPALGQIAKTAAAVLLPVIETWASVLQALTPAIQVVADVFTALVPIFRLASTFMAGWVEQIKQWITALLPGKDGVKSFTDQLGAAFREIARVVLLAVASFAKLLGLSGFVDGLIKSLSGTMAQKEKTEGQAAPTGAQFTSVTDIGRTLALGAFSATAVAEPKKVAEDFLKEMAESLKLIQSGQRNLILEAARYIVDNVTFQIDTLRVAIAMVADKLTVGAYDFERNILNDIGRRKRALNLEPPKAF